MPSALSISSHVVHGYVGNRAMVFPLQFSGWDVDALNTTNYSNHPGYGKFKGTKSTTDGVKDLFQGLNDIIDLAKDYQLIITGYTPSKDVLQIVFDQISELYNSNMNPTWILDPVLGDNGKLYVLEDIIPVYKKILSSGHVTLTTPNQFEFELLSGVKINDLDSIRHACEKFKSIFKVSNLVITSIEFIGKIYSIGYTSSNELFCIEITKIECSFNGCGDLFTALLANEFYNNQLELTPKVLGNVLNRLHKILQHTFECEKTENKEPFTVVKDLRIISLRQYLLEPSQVLDYDVIYL